MADTTIDTQVKSGPSLVVQIGVLVVLTLVTGGAGWLSGGYLGLGGSVPAAAPTTETGQAPAGDHAQPEGGEHGTPGVSNVVDIAPITTNLAVPDTTWIRLELSLVFDKPPEDPALPDLVQQDLMAYIRTVKLMQIEGASGYQYLKSDLLERAGIRSGGLVKDVLVRTMLVE